MSDDGYRRRPLTMSLTELNALQDDDGGESCLHPAIDFEADFEGGSYREELGMDLHVDMPFGSDLSSLKPHMDYELMNPIGGSIGDHDDIPYINRPGQDLASTSVAPADGQSESTPTRKRGRKRAVQSEGGPEETKPATKTYNTRQTRSAANRLAATRVPAAKEDESDADDNDDDDETTAQAPAKKSKRTADDEDANSDEEDEDDDKKTGNKNKKKKATPNQRKPAARKTGSVGTQKKKQNAKKGKLNKSSKQADADDDDSENDEEAEPDESDEDMWSSKNSKAGKSAAASKQQSANKAKAINSKSKKTAAGKKGVAKKALNKEEITDDVDDDVDSNNEDGQSDEDNEPDIVDDAAVPQKGNKRKRNTNKGKQPAVKKQPLKSKGAAAAKKNQAKSANKKKAKAVSEDELSEDEKASDEDLEETREESENLYEEADNSDDEVEVQVGKSKNLPKKSRAGKAAKTSADKKPKNLKNENSEVDDSSDDIPLDKLKTQSTKRVAAKRKKQLQKKEALDESIVSAAEEPGEEGVNAELSEAATGTGSKMGGLLCREPILSTMVLNQSVGSGVVPVHASSSSETVVFTNAGAFSAHSVKEQRLDLRIPDQLRRRESDGGEGLLSSPSYNDQLVIDTSLNVSELDQKPEESDNSETDVERDWSGTSKTNAKRPQGDNKTAKKGGKSEPTVDQAQKSSSIRADSKPEKSIAGKERKTDSQSDKKEKLKDDKAELLDPRLSRAGDSSRVDVEKRETSKQIKGNESAEGLSAKTGGAIVPERCRGPNCSKMPVLSTIYCSESCIHRHAEESLELLENERNKGLPGKPKSDSRITGERVVVFERKTGKLVTGPAAPTDATLHSWLMRHPTFEVLQPNQQAGAAKKESKKPEKKPGITVIPAKELPQSETSKPSTGPFPSSVPSDNSALNADRSKPPTGVQPYPESGPSVTSFVGSQSGHEAPIKAERLPSAPDPARISIRNSLRETLFARANETDDVMVSAAEVKRLALAVEEELFSFYGEVDTKYKHKFRTLITHLKDPKNQGLFRKVLFGDIGPFRLVRMTSEALGSREMTRWREPDAKSMGLMPPSVKVPDMRHVKKPLLETPNIPPSAGYSETGYDYLSTMILDTTQHHGRHFFDVNCKICTGKIPDPLYDEELRKPAASASAASLSSHVPAPAASHTDIAPVSEYHREDVPAAATVVAEISRDPRDPRRNKVSSIPTGTASASSSQGSVASTKAAVVAPPVPLAAYPLLSPEALEQSLLDETSPIMSTSVHEPQPVWKGCIYAQEIAKVSVSAYLVSGQLYVPKEDLTDSIVITGRLPPDNVFNYLMQIRACSTGATNREITVLRLQSVNSDGPYAHLFSYLHSRNRCGVVNSWGTQIRDMYILPLPAQSLIPPTLLPFEGEGLPIDRSNLLLAIIVMHKVRPAAVALAPTAAVASTSVSTAAVLTSSVATVSSSTSGPPVVASSSSVPSKSTTAPSAKTWMYAERPDIVETGGSDPKIKSAKTPTNTNTLLSSTDSQDVEEYTPMLPTLDSKALSTAVRTPQAVGVGVMESSDQSDAEEAEPSRISEVLKKDPIVSKYSIKEVVRKKTEHKSLAVDDDERPYDPFGDDDTIESPPPSLAPLKQQPAPSTTASVTNPTATVSAKNVGSINLAQLVDNLTKTGSSPEMTATVLSTLVATSPDAGPEEQKQIFQKLTEALRERQRLLDQLNQQSTSTASSTPGSSVVEGPASKTVNSTFQSHSLQQSNVVQKTSDVILQSANSASVMGAALPAPMRPQTAMTSLSTATAFTASSLVSAAAAAAAVTSASATVPPVLPPSINQLLTGQSFENLKNILASVSKKPDFLDNKTDSTTPQFVETKFTGVMPSVTATSALVNDWPKDNAMLSTAAASGWPTGAVNYHPMMRPMLPMQADPSTGLPIPGMFNIPMMPMLPGMVPFRPEFMHAQQQQDLKPPHSSGAIAAMGYPTPDGARLPRPLLPTPSSLLPQTAPPVPESVHSSGADLPQLKPPPFPTPLAPYRNILPNASRLPLLPSPASTAPGGVPGMRPNAIATQSEVSSANAVPGMSDTRSDQNADSRRMAMSGNNYASDIKNKDGREKSSLLNIPLPEQSTASGSNLLEKAQSHDSESERRTALLPTPEKADGDNKDTGRLDRRNQDGRRRSSDRFTSSKDTNWKQQNRSSAREWDNRKPSDRSSGRDFDRRRSDRSPDRDADRRRRDRSGDRDYDRKSSRYSERDAGRRQTSGASYRGSERDAKRSSESAGGRPSERKNVEKSSSAHDKNQDNPPVVIELDKDDDGHTVDMSSSDSKFSDKVPAAKQLDVRTSDKMTEQDGKKEWPKGRDAGAPGTKAKPIVVGSADKVNDSSDTSNKQSIDDNVIVIDALKDTSTAKRDEVITISGDDKCSPSVTKDKAAREAVQTETKDPFQSASNESLAQRNDSKASSSDTEQGRSTSESRRRTRDESKSSSSSRQRRRSRSRSMESREKRGSRQRDRERNRSRSRSNGRRSSPPSDRISGGNSTRDKRKLLPVRDRDRSSDRRRGVFLRNESQRMPGRVRRRSSPLLGASPDTKGDPNSETNLISSSMDAEKNFTMNSDAELPVRRHLLPPPPSMHSYRAQPPLDNSTVDNERRRPGLEPNRMERTTIDYGHVSSVGQMFNRPPTTDDDHRRDRHQILEQNTNLSARERDKESRFGSQADVRAIEQYRTTDSDRDKRLLPENREHGREFYPDNKGSEMMMPDRNMWPPNQQQPQQLLQHDPIRERDSRFTTSECDERGRYHFDRVDRRADDPFREDRIGRREDLFREPEFRFRPELAGRPNEPSLLPSPGSIIAQARGGTPREGLIDRFPHAVDRRDDHRLLEESNRHPAENFMTPDLLSAPDYMRKTLLGDFPATARKPSLISEPPNMLLPLSSSLQKDTAKPAQGPLNVLSKFTPSDPDQRPARADDLGHFMKAMPRFGEQMPEFRPNLFADRASDATPFGKSSAGSAINEPLKRPLLDKGDEMKMAGGPLPPLPLLHLGHDGIMRPPLSQAPQLLPGPPRPELHSELIRGAVPQFPLEGAQLPNRMPLDPGFMQARPDIRANRFALLRPQRPGPDSFMPPVPHMSDARPGGIPPHLPAPQQFNARGQRPPPRQPWPPGPGPQQQRPDMNRPPQPPHMLRNVGRPLMLQNPKPSPQSRPNSQRT